MSASDFLRYLLIAIVGFVVLGFGLKFWGKHRAQKEIVTELQSLTSSSSSFEQFTSSDAEKTLYRSLYLLHDGEKRLHKSPLEILNKVFGIRKPGVLVDDDYETPLRNEIVIEALLRNYENCRRLGIFDSPPSRNSLEKGRPPQIQVGLGKGGNTRIKHIIDPKVAPGVEKIIPNLVISPTAKDPGEKLTDFEISAALSLLKSFERADLLEREAADRLREFYNNGGKLKEENPDGTESDKAA